MRFPPAAGPCLRARRAWLVRAAAAAFGAWAPWLAVTAQPSPWDAMGDGAVVLFRHANAPGVGDPPGFKLGDCATQRNLDDAGRAQARRMGATFLARGIRVAAVWTSQWCRASETAELAFPGLSRAEPAFNSFFDTSDAAPAQTDQAKSALARWRGPGVLVVVTHQVNIAALTGISPASGEGVVIRMQRGSPVVLGRVQP